MQTFAVLINFVGSRLPLTKEVEAALETVPADWLRLAPGQYIVHCNSQPHAIYNAVKPVLHTDDLILVIAVDLRNRYGWVQNVAIDWIQQKSP